MSKLQEIQFKLKAPKGQYNNFGKYKYRSCEDILEAVKPILNEVGCTLTLSDEPILIGDRYYIKATAWLRGEDTNEAVTAYAREAETKSGMDVSQVTGTASSYARKYALNGLFCIDDTKDADTDEYANQTAKKPAPAPAPAPTGVGSVKEILNSAHAKWQVILDAMVAGQVNLKQLQKAYAITASAEKEILDYVNQHSKKA